MGTAEPSSGTMTDGSLSLKRQTTGYTRLMRLWRIYGALSLSGLALLFIGIAVTECEGKDDFGILLLTEYWIALCVIVGLILVFVRLAWRLATRFVKPS
jgi:hypothetical protein